MSFFTDTNTYKPNGSDQLIYVMAGEFYERGCIEFRFTFSTKSQYNKSFLKMIEEQKITVNRVDVGIDKEWSNEEDIGYTYEIKLTEFGKVFITYENL